MVYLERSENYRLLQIREKWIRPVRVETMDQALYNKFYDKEQFPGKNDF